MNIIVKRILLLSMLCLLLMGVNVHAEQCQTSETYIVKFKNSVQLFNLEGSESDHSRNFSCVSYKELQEYLELGIVEYYEPDYEVTLFDDTAAVGQMEQWNLSSINIEPVWNIGCYGNDVRVGVIDSGVYAHTDLDNNILEGRSYTGDDESDYLTDNIGHGTFVSAIIAAESNGSYMDGVAPYAKIVPLKCFDTGVTTTVSMVTNAIYDAVDVFGCDVINMSFGMEGSSTTLKLAVNYAIEKGCIVVASVGNDGKTTEYYPAKYENVIGVGSVDEGGERSDFSQYNQTVDVTAPGGRVPCIGVNGCYYISGTSFSAPHVSAIAAIAKCINADMTTSQFMQLVMDTSTDAGTAGRDDYYGWGIINAKKLVDAMLGQTDIFLSPVTNGVIKVYNNTDVPFSALGVSASYTGKVFFGSSFHPISLGSKGVAEIPMTGSGESLRFMLWSSLADMRPLCHTREY